MKTIGNVKNITIFLFLMLGYNILSSDDLSELFPENFKCKGLTSETLSEYINSDYTSIVINQSNACAWFYNMTRSGKFYFADFILQRINDRNDSATYDMEVFNYLYCKDYREIFSTVATLGVKRKLQEALQYDCMEITPEFVS